MKIIQAGGKAWSKEVTCIGKGWEQSAFPCGAILELDENDVIKRTSHRYGGSKETDYGFLCPQCGCFTIVPYGEIPNYITNKARSWRSDCGFIDELDYEHPEES